MKITIAQLNPIVGDIEGNMCRLINALSESSRDSSDLIITPELFITGYPPWDLLERGWFIEKVQGALQELVKISAKYPCTGILCGVPVATEKGSNGKGLYNSAILIYQGKILFTQHKSLLPAYDVFDERRYFEPAPDVQVISFKGETLGITICEDAWSDPDLWPGGKIYNFDPVKALVDKGATLLVNISASPYYTGKEELRYRMIRGHALKHKIPFAFVNQVGGNDELIFDGRSMYVDKEGNPAVVNPSFREEIKTFDINTPGTPELFNPQEKVESVYEALVLGIRDYLRKTGFSKAVLGLSGGIDSAVTCCLAQEALGSKNVMGISMPSPYSSRGSVEDSRLLAHYLGIEFKVININVIYSSYLLALQEHFEGKEEDVTEENIQSRIRGNILMAFSNKFGYMVLSTGNKSELAVGYCTLYGDMSGGLSVLSDVPKTLVYDLANYINRKSEIIPYDIIEKPPSAELKSDQLDQDTLPPYEILDQILFYFIEEGYSQEELIKMNFNPETVKWVTETVDRNEYKRKQAAPGLKVTTKAFGVGRRMPVAARYGS